MSIGMNLKYKVKNKKLGIFLVIKNLPASAGNVGSIWKDPTCHNY